jgi:hypothetical protein
MSGQHGGFRRLWDVLRPATSPGHPEPGDLGQYASLLYQARESKANAEFPAVAAHLATGCRRCQSDLQELLDFMSNE